MEQKTLVALAGVAGRSTEEVDTLLPLQQHDKLSESGGERVRNWVPGQEGKQRSSTDAGTASKPVSCLWSTVWGLGKGT